MIRGCLETAWSRVAPTICRSPRSMSSTPSRTSVPPGRLASGPGPAGTAAPGGRRRSRSTRAAPPARPARRRTAKGNCRLRLAGGLPVSSIACAGRRRAMRAASAASSVNGLVRRRSRAGSARRRGRAARKAGAGRLRVEGRLSTEGRAALTIRPRSPDAGATGSREERWRPRVTACLGGSPPRGAFGVERVGGARTRMPAACRVCPWAGVVTAAPGTVAGAAGGSALRGALSAGISSEAGAGSWAATGCAGTGVSVGSASAVSTGVPSITGGAGLGIDGFGVGAATGAVCAGAAGSGEGAGVGTGAGSGALRVAERAGRNASGSRYPFGSDARRTPRWT
jgi:hypothetical protein